MKDQYFGDINDYRKYGLLRGLMRDGNLRTTVCWMLTPPDDRRDGGKIGYLEQPQRWRAYDPELYDWVRHTVLERDTREVGQIEVAGLLPQTQFHSALVPRSSVERTAYMQSLQRLASGSELVFFDPDNGLEVASVRPGSSGSVRYLFWSEAAATFRMGASLLIYQHFARVQRERFIQGLALRLMQMCACDPVLAIRTSHVVFLLVPRPGMGPYWRSRLASAEAAWKGQFQVSQPIANTL